LVGLRGNGHACGGARGRGALVAHLIFFPTSRLRDSAFRHFF
jgi:hypothetical protein